MLSEFFITCLKLFEEFYVKLVILTFGKCIDSALTPTFRHLMFGRKWKTNLVMLAVHYEVNWFRHSSDTRKCLFWCTFLEINEFLQHISKLNLEIRHKRGTRSHFASSSANFTWL